MHSESNIKEPIKYASTFVTLCLCEDVTVVQMPCGMSVWILSLLHSYWLMVTPKSKKFSAENTRCCCRFLPCSSANQGTDSGPFQMWIFSTCSLNHQSFCHQGPCWFMFFLGRFDQWLIAETTPKKSDLNFCAPVLQAMLLVAWSWNMPKLQQSIGVFCWSLGSCALCCV